MTPNRERQTTDDGVFDLLVDGELGESDRRKFLARLDEIPDGWRRCALAFLEAQCWRQGLGQMRQPGEADRRPAAKPLRKSFLAGGRGTLLAMAASFAAALLLGIAIRGALTPGKSPAPGPERIAAGEPAGPPAPEKPSPNPPAGEELPPAAPFEAPPEYVTIPVSGPDGGEEAIRLPVVQRDSVDEAWLDRLPTAVPAGLVEAFLETGHEVRQQRRLLPLRTRDGRRVVVPYDQLEIRYIGRNAYQ